MAGAHRRRTLRGRFTEGDVVRLVVDDGRLNHGYKVISFIIAGEPDSASNDCFATLSIDYDAPLGWNWGDNRQIGWASTTAFNAAGLEAPFVALDPDHIVIQDLYIQGQLGAAGGTGVINYMIELETTDLTDDQAILTLIKERSQDDSR